MHKAALSILHGVCVKYLCICLNSEYYILSMISNHVPKICDSFKHIAMIKHWMNRSNCPIYFCGVPAYVPIDLTHAQVMVHQFL